jgi:tetratricopeptide (TPR) repeat protein
MSLFENGSALLACEQFFPAEKCFRQVVRFDPKCYEAYVDLGYARLMQYCDKLDDKDLQKMHVGQFICGAFYRRARSLEAQVRGTDRELWQLAVNALRDALQLKPGLALARANLGLAYLVHPEGNSADRAVKELEAAWESIADERGSVSDFDRAVVQINLAAARLAAGNRKGALQQLNEAKMLVDELKKQAQEATQPLLEAIRYNQALTLADSGGRDGKQAAARVFEDYLRDGDSYSAWWSLAYRHYAELCQGLNIDGQNLETLKQVKNTRLRMLTTVTFPDGKSVSRGEKIAEVLQRLGKHTMLAVADSTLKRYRFESYPVEVLATDRVQAIILDSKKAPPVEVRQQGLGPGSVAQLRVGMSRGQVLATLPGARSPGICGLVEPGPSNRYIYYRSLGLALRYDDDYPGGNIAEMILVQTVDQTLVQN